MDGINKRMEENREYKETQQKAWKHIEKMSEITGEKRYPYISDGIVQSTRDKGVAAAFNARHRFFNMNKLEQAVNKLNGQKAKFDQLWKAVDDLDLTKAEREKAGEELDKMFGGRRATI